MKKIVLEDTETIREAEKVFMRSANDSPADDVGKFSKLFVLQKYLFHVPMITPDGKGLTTAFGAPALTKKTYDSIWPLSFDKHGTLHLTGRFHGFEGGGYNYLAEFDYFHIYYGVREIVATKDGV